MFVLALLFVYGVSGFVTNPSETAEKVIYNIEDAETLFENFIETYNKQYDSNMEKQKRFEIFKQKLQTINQKNAEDSLVVFGITQFTDLTTEEVLELYTGFLDVNVGSDNCTIPNMSELDEESVPDNFDWRDQNVVTEVKNQGECGSCWAFSTTGNVEGQYAKKHNQLVEFSEQQLVDCDTTSLGCRGGLMTFAIRYLMKNGVVTEQDYPYVPRKETCKNKPTKAKVTGCMDYSKVTEDQLKAILYNVGPLAIGIYADGFLWSHYNKGIFMDCANRRNNHGVLLVGYGVENDTPYWTIKNSWGKEWGENGYIRIYRGNKGCGITTYVVSSEVA